MHDEEPSFRVTGLDIIGSEVVSGVRFLGIGGDGEETGGFIDDEYMVVLKDDREGEFRSDGSVSEVKRDDITGHDRESEVGGCVTVDRDLSAFQEAFCVVTGLIIESGEEEGQEGGMCVGYKLGIFIQGG